MIDAFLEILRGDDRPLLTREQEAALGRRVQAGDRAAHAEFVERNLRLAVSVAKRHRNRGLDFEELVQAAALGVMHAVDKYDPELGWKFSSYCTWWCRHEIGRALQNTSRTVRLSAPVYADLNRIRTAERQLLVTTSDPITPELIAAHLGDLTAERVTEVQHHGQQPRSLHSPHGDYAEFGEIIPDSAPGTEALATAALEDERLAAALQTLPYRQRRIVIMRHGLAGEAEHTLHHIADVFKIQREQVSVLLRRAEAALADALA